MKKLFYIGLLGLILFELAHVYFIMPLPGSQEMNSIDIAYFLNTWRWFFRIMFGIMAVSGVKSAFKSTKIAAILSIVLVASGVYIINFNMSADTMFYAPSNMNLKNVTDNKVEKNRLIVGITYNNEAKAYPIQYIGYHHQVRDSIGGKPVMITYCTVCRTARVYEPLVKGQLETFRLVGMDHFNALFEDKTTQSRWLKRAVFA